MPKKKWAVVLGLAVGVVWARAEEAPKALRLGVQAGLMVPAGDDLRITTGSGLNPAFGVHATWDINAFHRLRSRLDLWTFSPGEQEVLLPQPQHIKTRLQALSLGGEYLYRPGGRQGRWAVGAGLYVIRWSVESTNQLSAPGAGTAQAAGTSHWFREGLGLVATYRLSSRLDAEVHWIASHYGYENLPANLGAAGLLWRF